MNAGATLAVARGPQKTHLKSTVATKLPPSSAVTITGRIVTCSAAIVTRSSALKPYPYSGK
jgi:hypothetical protein